MSLKVTEFSDREILARVSDTINEFGVATSGLVARQLGLRDVDAHSVGSRMAWMHKYGVIDKDLSRNGKTPTHWLITPFGEAMLAAKINPTMERTLMGLQGPTMVKVMQDIVMGRYTLTDEDTQAQMIRRAFVFGHAQRRARFRGWG